MFDQRNEFNILNAWIKERSPFSLLQKLRLTMMGGGKKINREGGMNI